MVPFGTHQMRLRAQITPEWAILLTIAGKAEIVEARQFWSIGKGDFATREYEPVASRAGTEGNQPLKNALQPRIQTVLR